MGGGGVSCEKWTFPQRRVHYVQYQYFFILHFTYLGGGGAYTARRELKVIVVDQGRWLWLRLAGTV